VFTLKSKGGSFIYRMLGYNIVFAVFVALASEQRRQAYEAGQADQCIDDARTCRKCTAEYGSNQIKIKKAY
jgi:hypothetical protein